MRKITVSALIGLGLAVSACGGSSSNRGLESAHQPVVKRTDFVLDIDAGMDGLAPSEARRVSGWLEALRVGYGDHISVDMPYGSGSNTREVVASLAAKHGLLLDDTAPVTAGDVAPGTARIVVSRVSASVPTCPDWRGSTMADFNNKTFSNYGCSVNSNLAAMVANPNDLVRGAENMSPADTATASNAIKAYREGKSKAFNAESAKGN